MSAVAAAVPGSVPCGLWAKGFYLKLAADAPGPQETHWLRTVPFKL